MTPSNPQPTPWPTGEILPVSHSLWRRAWDFLRLPPILVCLNISLLWGAYIANQLTQVYCQPVLWAGLALLVCFMPVVFWPVLRRRWPSLHRVWQVLRGIAFCICIYCIAFIGPGNLLLPLLIPFGIGILGLAPHIFAVILIYQNFGRKIAGVQQRLFAAGIAFSVLVAGYFVWDFQAAIPIARALTENPQAYEGPHAGSVEWILGMHFKYHTRQNIGIDGWRPPLHDPMGVIGLWGNGGRDPLTMPLEQRIAIYHQAFPLEPVEVNCTCARDRDGMSYQKDPLFQPWGE